jgi:2-iminobutanoate/2-iminopropanoate deaminase
MDKRQVNPWQWQDAAGFSQAWRVDGAATIVAVSGQASIGPNGELVGEGDFAAQTRQVFQNLATVLEQAGASFDAVVKLTVFLTDMTKLREYTQIKSEFFTGPHPASSAVGVNALARPELLLEVEALAVL